MDALPPAFDVSSTVGAIEGGAPRGSTGQRIYLARGCGDRESSPSRRQVRVAVGQFRPRIGDPDHRPAVEDQVAEPLGPEPGAVREPVEVLPPEPVAATQRLCRHWSLPGHTFYRTSEAANATGRQSGHRDGRRQRDRAGHRPGHGPGRAPTSPFPIFRFSTPRRLPTRSRAWATRGWPLKTDVTSSGGAAMPALFTRMSIFPRASRTLAGGSSRQRRGWWSRCGRPAFVRSPSTARRGRWRRR